MGGQRFGIRNQHRLEVAKEEYHDIELIKITMYQPMLCQPNDETKYCVENIIWML
jgi:hypothetical protein